MMPSVLVATLPYDCNLERRQSHSALTSRHSVASALYAALSQGDPFACVGRRPTKSIAGPAVACACWNTSPIELRGGTREGWYAGDIEASLVSDRVAARRATRRHSRVDARWGLKRLIFTTLHEFNRYLVLRTQQFRVIAILKLCDVRKNEHTRGL